MKTALKFDSIAPNGHLTFALRVYDPDGWFMYHVGTLWADRITIASQPPYFIVTLFMSDSVHFIAVVDEIDLGSAPPGIREKFQKGARVDVRAEVL
jgi:hypothetical protein